MSCHTGAGDNHLYAPLLRSLCIFKKSIGHPMCRNNPHFIGNTEFVQNLSCFCHYRHIGITAHYNTDLCHVLLSSCQNMSQLINLQCTKLFWQMQPIFVLQFTRTVWGQISCSHENLLSKRYEGSAIL